MNLNKSIKKSTDINILKNKIQTIYSYSLIIFSLFVITLCLSTIPITSTYATSDIIKCTLVMVIGGSALAIPIYRLQNRIHKASYKEREVTNVILNAYFILLSALLFFVAYNLFSLITFL